MYLFCAFYLFLLLFFSFVIFLYCLADVLECWWGWGKFYYNLFLRLAGSFCFNLGFLLFVLLLLFVLVGDFGGVFFFWGGF